MKEWFMGMTPDQRLYTCFWTLLFVCITLCFAMYKGHEAYHDYLHTQRVMYGSH